MAVASVFPVLVALILSPYGYELSQHEQPGAVSMRAETVSSVPQLESLFVQHDYHWPPAEAVPALAIKTLPRPTQNLSIEKKKSLFFRAILPLVLAENMHIEAQRNWLKQLRSRKIEMDPMRIEQLARVYRVDLTLPVEQQISQLWIKVDVIPAGLVLAQAANESGWGSSRFSLEVNNLFGEWTYNAASGVLPANRPEGAYHYVRRFDSLRASVRSYMQNLNSGRAYTLFRRLRADMRQKGKPLDPIVLAEGLKRYSARGDDYIREIQALIRHNDLNSLGPLDLVR